jgi:hypothetical protein
MSLAPEREPRPCGVRHRLWAVAAAGNCTALAIVALVLINSRPLFELERPPASQDRLLERTAGQEAASKVLLIVIDALRLDTARDDALMPQLARLADRGGQGVAIVDSLIPSTVAGIRVIATGKVPPAASFFEDFGAGHSRDGGIFSSVRRAGGRSFVAGTHLWTDLYGEWIDSAEIVATVGENDERVLAAAEHALADDSYALVVVHFSRCDDLAHRHGAFSRQYRAGARWCDNAVGALVSRADPSVAVIVTTDHGVTASGGHAGPEADVRRTPLVLAGRALPRGPIGEVSQSAIRPLVESALGIEPPVGHAKTVTRGPSPWDLSFVLLAASVTLLSLLFLIRLGASPTPCWQSTALDATLWCSIALAATWQLYAFALALALLALSIVAVVPSRRAAGSASLLPVFGFAVGAVLGAWRIFDASTLLEDPPMAGEERLRLGCFALALGVPAVSAILRSRAPRELVDRPLAPLGRSVGAAVSLAAGALLGGVSLLIVVCLGLLTGRALGRASCSTPTAPYFGGVGLVVALALLVATSGETVSLSTIDVHLAFDRVDGWFGLPGAVAVVVLRHSLPAVALLVGALPVLGTAPSSTTRRLLSASGATILGEAVIASGCFAVSAESAAAGSLAVGALVRVLSEANFVFLGAALLLALSVPLEWGLRRTLLCFNKRTAQNGSASTSTRGSGTRSSIREHALPRPCED